MTTYDEALHDVGGFGMFGLLVVRWRTFQAHILKVRSQEYHRGYKSGHVDGVKAGHSAEWHDGYNQGTRTQNGVDILTRTVRMHDGKVTSIRGLLDTLRTYTMIVDAKDQQIELLQNRVASLQGIIRTIEAAEIDDDVDDSE